jgi:mannonate dehydratase
MKLGLGLYNHQLDEEHFTFAQQAGCTHLIIHLATYYKNEIVSASDSTHNYGQASDDDNVWSLENLVRLQKMAKEHDLTIAGIENFNPAHWYDVLLAGPLRDQQLEHLKNIIRTVGKAGIHTFGYNFSLAGVWGHQRLPVARGGAVSACFDVSQLNANDRIPNGDIWNMTYKEGLPGYVEQITHEELWARLAYFLHALLPVAEEAGVELALHPDDPPMDSLRGTPRLVYQPWMYQKLIDLNPSPMNKIDFCMGSIQEMAEGNLYDAIEKYAGQNRISYVHFRNVVGKVPHYKEVFIDEGDIDMVKALRLFKKTHFDGVLIPDHTPSMIGADGWRIGMAYALGYMKAAFSFLEENNE